MIQITRTTFKQVSKNFSITLFCGNFLNIEKVNIIKQYYMFQIYKNTF